MRLSESGDTQATETLLPHNNHDTTHPHPPKDPMMANRQAIKDSSKTLTSESATALLVREDLKDNSGVARSQDAPGSGARGSFNGQGRVYSPRASGMIHLQEPKYVDITRRGSTMTSLSDTTQTTYRVNFDTSQNKGYLSEKHSHGSGYDSGRASPLSLSVLSPTTPKSPIGIFGEAGSNNGASAPNGKRYIDTRKRNKKQKAFGKKSFKKHKTLFSNERTFIHWIKFVYAAGSYHWRHVGIVKDAGYDRYFDRIGPTFLTIALLGTYVMNVVLTIQVSSLMDHGYAPTVYLNNNPESHNNSPVTTNTSSTTIPQSSNQSIPTSSFQPSPPPSPPLPPPPAPVQPHKPVFDTPYLPPGSTILVDGDGEENEFRGNGNDPTVMTASNNTEEEDHPSDTDTSSDSIKDEPADTRASSSPSSDSDSETAQVTTTSSSDDDE
ncbi:hypothetical protein FBU30_000044 [Linnemannia zychae]|nr:hypothetical protein FBU30_000044 [Linnemannia zychae]